MDALTTLLACFGLLATAALAVGVLPWSDDELADSERAWVALLSLPLAWIARWREAPAADVSEMVERKAA